MSDIRSRPHSEKNGMQSLTTRLIAQAILTFLMALTMSGIMGFLALGTAFLPHWLGSFIVAWPIAFVLSQFVGPISFRLAHRLTPARRG